MEAIKAILKVGLQLCMKLLRPNSNNQNHRQSCTHSALHITDVQICEYDRIMHNA